VTISRPILLLTVHLLVSEAALCQIEAPPLDPRADADEQFRAQYAAGNYAAALLFALQIVRMTELQGEPLQLTTAYNSLGATQLQLNDLDGAETSYQRSLDLATNNFGLASKRLIPPLAGLGAVYAARDQHSIAAEYLRHALAVSRRADGLFNLPQLRLMDSLIASYNASGDTQSVLSERLYALQIANRNFGSDDPHVLPAVKQLAAQYESMSDYPNARLMYLRMHEIALHEGSESNPDLVAALLGIGRSHRMQFTTDPFSLLEPDQYKDPVTGKFVPLMQLEPYQAPRPNRDGRRAVEEALTILRKAEDPPPRLLADALIEMGDWNLVQGKNDAAIPNYAEAWSIYAAELPMEPNPLSAPRLVFYRAPVAARRNRAAFPGPIMIRTARFKLQVDASGAPRDIVLEGADMSEQQASIVRRSLDDALYSPRFEDGKPVPTADVGFIGHWQSIDRETSTPKADKKNGARKADKKNGARR